MNRCTDSSFVRRPSPINHPFLSPTRANMRKLCAPWWHCGVLLDHGSLVIDHPWLVFKLDAQAEKNIKRPRAAIMILRTENFVIGFDKLQPRRRPICSIVNSRRQTNFFFDNLDGLRRNRFRNQTSSSVSLSYSITFGTFFPINLWMRYYKHIQILHSHKKPS